VGDCVLPVDVGGDPGYATGYNLDRVWVRTPLPSGRAIDGAYGNGGRLYDLTYPEGVVALSYFDNTDRAGTIMRTAAPVPDNTTQTLVFSYDGFLTTPIAYSGVAMGVYWYSFDAHANADWEGASLKYLPNSFIRWFH